MRLTVNRGFSFLSLSSVDGPQPIVDDHGVTPSLQHQCIEGMLSVAASFVKQDTR